MDLDDGQRGWLQEHTLEELQDQFKQASQKEIGQAGRTSQYRGVCLVKGKWLAKFHKRIKGNRKFFLQKLFESEQDAATAYDHTAIQLNGR